MGPDLCRPGLADDAGTRVFLWGSGAPQERAVHSDAMFHDHVFTQPAVGFVRLQPRVRTGYQGDCRGFELGGTSECQC